MWLEGTVVSRVSPNTWVLDDQTGCIACTLAAAPLSEVFWLGSACVPLSDQSEVLAALRNTVRESHIEPSVGMGAICFGVVLPLATLEGSIQTKVVVFGLQSSPDTGPHWLVELCLK